MASHDTFTPRVASGMATLRSSPSGVRGSEAAKRLFRLAVAAPVPSISVDDDSTRKAPIVVPPSPYFFIDQEALARPRASTDTSQEDVEAVSPSPCEASPLKDSTTLSSEKTEPGVDDVAQQLSVDELPKQQWEAIAMKRHPEILEYREVLRSVGNAKGNTYARSIDSARTQSKSAISARRMLQLVMEHLALHNCPKAVATISSEAGIPCLTPAKDGTGESRLMSLLRLALRRIPRKTDIFDPSLPKLLALTGEDEVEQRDHVPGRPDTTDVNIWDEPDTLDGRVVVAKNEIKAATINKLILYFVGSQDTLFNRMFAFMAESFISPMQLLKKLNQLYQVPSKVKVGVSDTAYKEHVLDVIGEKVISGLRWWISNRTDPLPQKTVQVLTSFMDGTLARDGHEKKVSQLKSLLEKMQSDWKARVSAMTIDPPEPIIPTNLFSDKMSLKHLDALEIARQLTLIEVDILSRVRVKELMGMAWKQAHQKHRAKHLHRLLDHYQEFRRWTAWHVISPDTKRRRVQMFTLLIRVAKHLKDLGNLHMLVAIVKGLQSPAVAQLYSLTSMLDNRARDDFQQLAVLCKGANIRKLNKSLFPPKIPFIPLILSDLEAIEESEADMLSGRMVNFGKCRLLFNVIEDLIAAGRARYHLQPVQQIADFLLRFPPLSDADLVELAVARESAK